MDAAMSVQRGGQNSLDLDFCEVPEDVVDGNSDVACILPGWNGARAIMAIPNCILRSGLFAATRAVNKEFMRRAPIESLNGISMVYTGMRLTQADLDVWHGLLSLSKSQFDPELVDMSAKGFLRMIGRSGGKSDREWLKGSVSKMSATTIEITHGEVTYGGSLIDEFYRDETTGRYKVKLNKKLAKLFSPAAWTAIDWNQRSALQGKPLALWLHAFYSSHRAPFDYKVETLMKLSGGSNEETYLFRRRLKAALVELVETVKWECSHDKETDTVRVSKSPPLSANP